ncbi:hypothetical protein ACFYRN_25100 [Streptomyces sp. NPDC005227]|uniref:hypothetical protein n=1 Tax=Streptomyces sp. NPDC005227 TaxID=3364707 RepID=UPI003681EFFA
MADELADPMTELAAAAVQQHELYESWVHVGFTPDQALELLKTVLHAGLTRGRG